MRLYATTQTESTRTKAQRVLELAVSSFIPSRPGGWEVLELLREAVESFALAPAFPPGFAAPPRAAAPIAFDALFRPVLLAVLRQLAEASASAKTKRKDPPGQLAFEALALPSFFALCFALGLTPAVPRGFRVTAEGGVESASGGELPELNVVSEANVEVLRAALRVWPELVPQLAAPTDNGLVEGTRPANIPVLEKGLVPVVVRALGALIIAEMRQLYQSGSVGAAQKEIVRYVELLEALLFSVGVLAKPKSPEIRVPKNDWSNQLLLNTSFLLFSLVSFTTRIVSSLGPHDSGKQQHTWSSLLARFWDTLELCLRNLTLLLVALDERQFGVLAQLEHTRAQALQPYAAWVPLFMQPAFTNSVEGMKHVLLAYRDQLTQGADRRQLEALQRELRCHGEPSALSSRLEEEVGLTVATFRDAFEKDASLSVIERETNGLKIIKKLWRELVLGPSMWHGVEASAARAEEARVYYQLDRKETVKHLRNRLKRDWNERPHRHVGRDLTGAKAAERSAELLKRTFFKRRKERAVGSA